MTKSSEYWQQRFDQIEQAANNRAVRYVNKLEKKYAGAAKELDTKINAWYQRLADNNGVSITEAKKLLSNSELKEFKWTVEEYIKYGKENELDQRWMKELENASAKFHINRLEALKLEARHQVEQVFADGQENMYNVLGGIYKDTFYHSCFEVQRGMGVGFDVSALDDNHVSKILNKPWSVDGTNFSEKLWGNKAKLINTLDQELSRMVLTGESPKKAIANIRRAMDSSKYAAKRLVLTEQAYFASVAQKDAYGELDVEEYEIVATLDSKTSEVCQDMDGKHFHTKEMSPGLNAPPFHVFCRTTTCPYFNDEFTVGDKRIAKDDEGQRYEVPAKMTYEEWKKEYVIDAMSMENKKQYSKYQKILGDNSPTIAEFAKIRYNDIEWKAFKAYASSIKSGELTPLAEFELYQNISKQIDEKIVGRMTSNGVAISGKSKHSIARIIGSVEQKRNGVEISDVLDALTNEESEMLPIKTMKNGQSQKFRNKKVEVSINPDTGNIIQVNPIHTEKKVK